MTPCDGTNSSSYWCCGDDTSCCASSNRIHLDQVFGVAETTSKAVSPSATSLQTWSGQTSTPTSGVPAPFTATPTPSVATGDELSTGAKAGIGVGVTVGAIAIVALLCFVCKALQWRNNSREIIGGAPRLGLKCDAAAMLPATRETEHVAELAEDNCAGGSHAIYS